METRSAKVEFRMARTREFSFGSLNRHSSPVGGSRCFSLGTCRRWQDRQALCDAEIIQ